LPDERVKRPLYFPFVFDTAHSLLNMPKPNNKAMEISVDQLQSNSEFFTPSRPFNVIALLDGGVSSSGV
jgi:hypothetical protein